jgi:glycosyltransferase involved in cell wall biosynthesis
MKIGFDAKRAVSNRTGLGNYSRSLLRELALQFPSNEYHLFSPTNDTGLIHTDLEQIPNWHLHCSKARIKAYWRSFSMVKDLKDAGIHIYHGLSNELPYGINKSGIRSVVTIHDLIFKVYPETYSLSERLVYDRKFRYACTVADKIVAVSEHSKQDICRFYGIAPEKICVIYQPCRNHFYTPRTDAENEQVRQLLNLPERYLLYVGTIEARKNLKSIIHAFETGLKLENTPLVIVGKGGDYAKDCKKEIVAAGLEPYFIWKEDVNDAVVLQSIIQMAAALIYPSSYEGFGLPVAEASLCGTPVITNNVSSLPEAGGKDVWYIDPKQPESISEAAKYILRHPEEADMRAQNAKAYIRTLLDPKKLTTQMMNCYLSLRDRQ